jgi:hypothetical protein
VILGEVTKSEKAPSGEKAKGSKKENVPSEKKHKEKER